MDYTLLGKKIREVRRRHDLTQEKLAEDINATHPYIGQVERGERGISIENLINLSNRLNVTVDYLLSDYYAKDHTEYYKGQWARLMQSRADFEQESVLNIVETVLKNMDSYTEQFITEYESTKHYIEKCFPIQNAEWMFRILPLRQWYQYPDTWILTGLGLCMSFLVAFLVHGYIELNALKNSYQHMSYTDALTGIHNRRYFMENAARQAERVARTNSSAFVIIFDVDHSKKSTIKTAIPSVILCYGGLRNVSAAFSVPTTCLPATAERNSSFS